MTLLELARHLSRLTPNRPCTKNQLREILRAGKIQATKKPWPNPLSNMFAYEIEDTEVERIKALWLKGN